MIRLGFARVLTSGGAPTAMEGKSLITNLLRQAAGRIEVMPGSGIRPENIRELAEATGARSFHFSASKMVELVGGKTGLPGLEAAWAETDPAIVRAMRKELVGIF